MFKGVLEILGVLREILGYGAFKGVLGGNKGGFRVTPEFKG